MFEIIKQNINSVAGTLIESSILNKSIIDVLENEFLIEFQSKETRSAYKRDVLTFTNQIGFEFLSDFSSVHISEMSKLTLNYVNSFKKVSGDRILNPNTINRKAYSLSSFFNFLVDKYNYPKNPLSRFKPEASHKTSNTQSLSKDEVKNITEYMIKNINKGKSYYRNYLLISLMSRLALRRSEVAKLKWSDINENSIGNTRYYFYVYQKGRNIKQLPIPIELYSHLMTYKERFCEDCEFIFTTSINACDDDLNKHISSTQVNRIIAKIVKELDIGQKITPHSFRKTFIETALDQNISLINISNATGHSSVEMIKYYDGRNKLDNNAINDILF